MQSANKKTVTASSNGFLFGGATQSRTGLDGFAIRCITALLSRQKPGHDKNGKLELPILVKKHARSFNVWSGKRDSNSRPQPWQGCALPTELFPHIEKSYERCWYFFRIFGAGNEIRTRDLNLGKVALYQLSYSRVFQ